ncbi:MAG: Hpt domain-containing protein [Actinomycetia bacterium]|nr:Hpt domain-containing protein [Actinomycetes bacterium]
MSRPVLDTRKLAGAVGDSLAQEFVDRVMVSLGESLPALENLCNGGDLAGVRALAHTLKSSTAAIGAMRVADALARLEQAAGAGQRSTAGSIMDTMPGLVDELREHVEDPDRPGRFGCGS